MTVRPGARRCASAGGRWSRRSTARSPGAGAVIATACDIRIAAESAQDRVPVQQGRAVGRRHGRLVAAAPHRRARPRDRAADDRRLHRRRKRAYGSASTTASCRPSSSLGEATALRGEARARTVVRASRSPSTRSSAKRRWTSSAGARIRGQIQAELMVHPNFREAYEAFRAKREPQVRLSDDLARSARRSARSSTSAHVELRRARSGRGRRASIAPATRAGGRCGGAHARRARCSRSWARPAGSRRSGRAATCARVLPGARGARRRLAARRRGLRAPGARRHADPARRRQRRAARRAGCPTRSRGRAMAAFAMTEPEAGSDVAAIATTARARRRPLRARRARRRSSRTPASPTSTSCSPPPIPRRRRQRASRASSCRRTRPACASSGRWCCRRRTRSARSRSRAAACRGEPPRRGRARASSSGMTTLDRCARPSAPRRAGWRRARSTRRSRTRARGGSSASRSPSSSSCRRSWRAWRPSSTPRACWSTAPRRPRIAAPSASRSRPRWRRRSPPRRRSASSTTRCRCCGGAGVLASAPGRAALPLGARAAHLRGHDRDPAPGDRGGEMLAGGPSGSEGRCRIGGGPAGLVLRAAAEASRPASRRRRLRAQPRPTTRSASAWCSPTRPMAALASADPEPDADDGARALPSLGRHRDPLPGRDASRSTGHGFSRAVAAHAARASSQDRCRARGRASSAFERDDRRSRDACATPISCSPPTAPTRPCASATATHFEPRSRRAAQPLRVARHDEAVPRLHVLFQARRARAVARARLPVRAATARRSSSSAASETWRAAGLEQRDRGRDDRVLRGAVRARSSTGTGWSSNRSHLAQLPDHPERALAPRATWCSMGDAAHTAHFSVGSGTQAGDGGRDRARVRALESAARRCRRRSAAYETERRPRGREPAARGAGSLAVVRGHRALHGARAAPVRVHAAHPQPAGHAREPARARSRVRGDGSIACGRPSRRRASRSGSRVPTSSPRAAADVHAVPAARAGARRTASSCRRCASTRPRTALPDDWHLVHLGSRAIGGAGLVIAEMTDVSPEARISPGCAGLYSRDARRRVEAHRRLRAPAESRRRSACSSATPAARRRRGGSWEGDNEPLPEGGWPLVSRRRRSPTSRTARCRAR